MPQSRERKREYMRGYMARRRALGVHVVPLSARPPLLLSPQGTNNRPDVILYKRNAVSPFPYTQEKAATMTWDEIKVAASMEMKARVRARKTPAQRMADYMKHIHAIGHTLQEFALPQSGERAYRLAPLPVSPETQRLSQELNALEAAYTQHQADHVILELGQRYTAADFTKEVP